MMNDLTFNILKIVISVVAALIAYYLIPVLKKVIADAKYKELVKIVSIAVEAAEQTYKQSGMGKVKKEDVLNFVTNWLNDKSIEVSPEQLDKLIESAVFRITW